jgi:hypothetical protein
VHGVALRLPQFLVIRYQAFGPASFVDAIAPSRSDYPRCSTAEQAARANAGICHAACDRRSLEMKSPKVNCDAARSAPAPVVAVMGKS